MARSPQLWVCADGSEAWEGHLLGICGVSCWTLRAGCTTGAATTGTSLAHAASGSRIVTRQLFMWDYTVTLCWEDSMRSLPLMAATTVILAGAWGCSSGSNTGPNTNPTASFTAPACTVGTACAFTDASTDADGTVTAWSWNFNDGTALDVNRNPSHTFATAGTFNVTLTVTDNAGGTGSTTVP